MCPINLGFEFYEKIFTIRNPSIKAVCCFIRGIIPFSCSMIVDQIFLIWDFANSKYKAITSCSFLETSFSSLFLKIYEINRPICSIASFLIYQLLLKQREIKKAEMKFHSVSANSSVFEDTKIIFFRTYSTILKYLLLF